MRIGIDGSNLRQGGGITHLVQLLDAAEPGASGISRVQVWGAQPLLDQLPDRTWLLKVREIDLERGGATRWRWQQMRLAGLARDAADLLFSPGGTYLGGFHPFVTMFRNMLPFDAAERQRYRYSKMRVKLELLRRAQGLTFGRADGVIFLTEHARAAVTSIVKLRGSHAVIPHGLDARFYANAVEGADRHDHSVASAFRWLYVSAIHSYKHPWNVVEAATALRAEGLPVTLDLVGPPYPPAMARLQSTISRLDPNRQFVTVTPGLPHAQLPAVYHGADGFVFASTCENMPNSLLEAMAAGLPIVCSDRSPMPEILERGGVYCDPESPASIAAAMKSLMADAQLRSTVKRVAQARAQLYSWSRCAKDTFDFLRQTALGHREPSASIVNRA